MAISLDAVGIQSIDTALVDTFDIEKKVSMAAIPASDGGFGAASTYDPQFDFSISGGGDLPVALVLAGDGGLEIDGISTGTTILTRVTQTQKVDGFNGWSVAGQNHPGTA